jgi:hypothetical protein
VVFVIVGKEQYVDRLTELVIECTSLLTRIDHYVTPLVRHERDSLAQPLPLHESVGSPADSRVRHVTVEHHMLDHGTTVKTCALRHNEVMSRVAVGTGYGATAAPEPLVSEGVPIAPDRPFPPASPITKLAARPSCVASPRRDDKHWPA